MHCSIGLSIFFHTNNNRPEMKFLAAVLCLGLPLLVLARFEECDNAPGADVQFPEAGMTYVHVCACVSRP